MGEFITIETLEGNSGFKTYRAAPAEPAKAAIIVIQEVFGVNAGIRARCDRWAAKGYLALAPDLFWRVQPEIDLDPDIAGDFKQAIEYMGKFNADDGVRDIEAVLRAARSALGTGRKAGVVGYCLGGRMTFLAAARTDSDACVAYYGGGIDSALGEAHAIANPVLLHFAEEDHFIDAKARRAIHDALDTNRHVTIHDYPDVDHGFATESGTRRREEAANLADSRTEAFFASHLG